MKKLKTAYLNLRNYFNEGLEDSRFDSVHKNITTKIIIPAIGIPSLLLILACFSLEPTVLFAIGMHIVVAGTNIYLTKENRIFKIFGRTMRSRDDHFDFMRWSVNLILLDPILYYLLNPTQSIHFSSWTMLTVAALIDTFKKTYRIRVVVIAAVMFFISHSVIFPSVRIVETLLLTSVMCSFVFVVWAIESRFLVSMIKVAEKTEQVLKQELEMERIESEAAFGRQLRTISHEINNILAIISMSESDSQSDIMRRAVLKLKTISSLVLEGSSTTRKKTKISVETLLEEVRILIKPMATHEGCQWQEEIDPQISGCEFEEFAGASFLILQNLVKNAVEELSGKSGVITFEVKKVNANVIFKIKDNGGGLSQNPFLDIQSNATTKASGHGIGLKFVHREAQKSGFEIGCHPGFKTGASFWVAAPLVSRLAA